MASKRQTTQYNHYTECVRRSEDIISRTIHFRLTHDQLLAELKELYESNSWKRLTQYYRAKISGRIDLHIENLYRYHLKWGHEYQGKTVFKWEDMPENVRYDSASFESYFYWMKEGKEPVIFS